jgi:hypothetical protein
MRQILLATLAGGSIVFVLAALQNAAFPAGEPRSIPSESAILPVLRNSIPQPGIYYFPGGTLERTMSKEERRATQAEHERRFREGPTGILVIRAGGVGFHFGRRLAVQLALSLLAALAAATILATTASATTYATRLAIVTLLGAFAFLHIEPQYWNWYGFPATYTIVRVAGGVASWVIAGSAMAAIVR